MALNFLPELESLAEEVGQLAGESPNEAIRKALEEREERLALSVVRGGDRKAQIRHWLETEVWPQIPSEESWPTPQPSRRRPDLGLRVGRGMILDSSAIIGPSPDSILSRWRG